MRILYVNHVGALGGAERSLLGIVDHLDRRAFEPFAAVPGGALAAALKGRGIDPFGFPFKRFRRTRRPDVFLGNLLNLAQVSWRLAGVARTQGIDILHGNSNVAQMYAATAARQAGLPSVWHSRDLVALGWQGRWLSRASTRVVAISDAVARHLTASGIHAEKLVTIRNGIDTAHFVERGAGQAVRDELGIGRDRYVVATVGQLVPWKKQTVFLDVARRVAEMSPAAFFLVVGSDLFDEHPEYSAELERLVREFGLSDRVLFTGHRRDMPGVLEAIDVLVHPATREPFGRVVVEAMAVGRPVVAADACGPAEIVRNGEDGFLTPPDDAGAMAQAVLSLAQDRALAARMGAAGRARARRDFDVRTTVRRLESLYEELGGGAMPDPGTPVLVNA